MKEINVRKKILIIGYSLNFGDKLLNKYLEDRLKSEFKIIKIKNKLNIIEIFNKTYKCYKIFIYGGIFQDISSLKSFLFYFFIIKLANILKKKIYIISTSYESLNNYLSKFLMKFIKIDFCWIRDQFSFKKLKKNCKNLILQKDPIDLLLNKNKAYTKLILFNKNNFQFFLSTNYSVFKSNFKNTMRINLIIVLNTNYNYEKYLNILFYNLLINLNHPSNLSHLKCTKIVIFKIKIIYTDFKEYKNKKNINKHIKLYIEKILKTNNKSYNSKTNRNYKKHPKNNDSTNIKIRLSSQIEDEYLESFNINRKNINNFFIQKTFNCIPSPNNNYIKKRFINKKEDLEANNLNVIISSRLHYNIIMFNFLSYLKNIPYWFYIFGYKNINYFKTFYPYKDISKNNILQL